MVKQFRHIALIFTLLILGGMANEAWADVTYHILTLPFTTKNTDGSNFKTDIRVEALRVVVQVTDNGGKVGLPEAYISPLLKPEAFHYYSASQVTASGSTVKVFANNNTTYTTYILGTPDLTAGTSDVSDNQHIYVVYDYDPSNSSICTPLGQSIKLDGTADYNIEVDDKNGGTPAFFTLNVVRGNRPAVLVASDLYDIDDITSKEPVEVKTGLFNDYDKVWGKLYYFRWKFLGSDPYNMQIVLSYNGTATYVEEGKTKPIYKDDHSNMLFS